MTMPTLIQNYQKQVYATRLKKAVNILDNMRTKLMADEEVTNFDDTKLIRDGYCIEFNSDIYNTQACGEDGYAIPSVFESELTKNFNVVKICKKSECNILYKDAYLSYGGIYKNMNSYSTVNDKMYYENFLIGIYTTDGFIYYFYSYADNSGPILCCFIDVNGEKGPNQNGRDFFTYEIRGNGGGYHDEFIKRLMFNGWKMDY